MRAIVAILAISVLPFTSTAGDRAPAPPLLPLSVQAYRLHCLTDRFAPVEATVGAHQVIVRMPVYAYLVAPEVAQARKEALNATLALLQQNALRSDCRGPDLLPALATIDDMLSADPEFSADPGPAAEPEPMPMVTVPAGQIPATIGPFELLASRQTKAVNLSRGQASYRVQAPIYFYVLSPDSIRRRAHALHGIRNQIARLISMQQVERDHIEILILAAENLLKAEPDFVVSAEEVGEMASPATVGGAK